MTPPVGSNVVIGGGRPWTVRELIDRAAGPLDRLANLSPLAMAGQDDLDLLAAACWLADREADGMVLDRERLTPGVLERLGQAGFSIVAVPSGILEVRGGAPIVPGRVHLLTSGSTGEPKLVRHRWNTLFTMARVRTPRPTRWLLTYQPGTYAWYQLLTALLFMPGQSLVLPAGLTPVEMIESAAREDVTAISATPTFWRMAMLQAEPADFERLGAHLRRVTLGGEAVDQPILDQLAALFPQAEITHIYASSEAGAAIVVQDGRAGFPVAWLEDEQRSPQLQVRDGRLFLRSPFAADDSSEWIDSQDIAEIRDDRVYLLGRSGNGMINVGGSKVYSADVERVLLGHPEVLWCRVRGVRAPLVGRLVEASVVVRRGSAGAHSQRGG